MKLSIIIPVFNEARTLDDIIRQVHDAPMPPGVAKEIIVVNDGSTDNSAKVLDGLQDKLDLKVFHQKSNQGKTAAVTFGIAKAAGDFILIQDADLEYSPRNYPKLLEPLLSQDAKVVYGSRFKGTIRGMLLMNRLANIFSNITFNLFFGKRLTDINTCFKIFPRQVFDRIRITSSHFVFETELTAKMIRLGYEIWEVPIHYQGRSAEHGKKMNAFRALQMFWGIIKYRFSPLA